MQHFVESPHDAEPVSPEVAVTRAIERRLEEARDKDLDMVEGGSEPAAHLIEERDGIRTIYEISEGRNHDGDPQHFVRKKYSVESPPVTTDEQLREQGFSFTDGEGTPEGTAGYVVRDRVYHFQVVSEHPHVHTGVDVLAVDSEGIVLKWRQATTYRAPSDETLQDLENKISALPLTSPDANHRDFLEASEPETN